MQVDFYFGAGSRYSYLASTQLVAIAGRTGARFRWRPVFSGDLAKAAGYSPFIGRPASGQYSPAYREQDVARWAEQYGVPYHGDPALDASQWRRLTLALVAAEDRTELFAHALYSALFARAEPLNGDVELYALAAQVGITDLEKRLEATDLEVRASGIVAEAVAAGAFGAPSFVAEGALFFGNDRLVLLERHLLRR
jgi:2-hydroxychromene-2-carboxylate isomerase